MIVSSLIRNVDRRLKSFVRGNRELTPAVQPPSYDVDLLTLRDIAYNEQRLFCFEGEAAVLARKPNRYDASLSPYLG